jgi:hypothetical protein
LSAPRPRRRSRDERGRKKALSNHATRMFNWHSQVAGDPEAKRQATAMRVVDFIRDKMRPTKSGVEFQQGWLADHLGVTRKGLQKALDWLAHRGHLHIEVRKHRRLANIYEPRVRCELQYAVDANCSSQNRQDSGTAVRTNPISINKTSVHPNDRASGKAPGIRREQAAELRHHRGDEQVERRVTAALGPHGFEILEDLHSRDGGRPYSQLIAACRDCIDQTAIEAAQSEISQPLAPPCGGSRRPILGCETGIADRPPDDPPARMGCSAAGIAQPRGSADRSCWAIASPISISFSSAWRSAPGGTMAARSNGFSSKPLRWGSIRFSRAAGSDARRPAVRTGFLRWWSLCPRPLGAIAIAGLALGRAPRSGRGGRRFKSCHSDQIIKHLNSTPKRSRPRNCLRSSSFRTVAVSREHWCGNEGQACRDFNVGQVIRKKPMPTKMLVLACDLTISFRCR